ncbi:hypothetical protein BGAL_0150g00200 [Botrytis galanthina]|uniref:Uncharacterized protein n=1 Tax=Botrytis galanthina TaxID=278940 RepID=A0A4V4HUS2_9HELO|nr:hypothetical protein BGAL_0150g00200 [Botrytis galanthina]
MAQNPYNYTLQILTTWVVVLAFFVGEKDFILTTQVREKTRGTELYHELPEYGLRDLPDLFLET